MHHFGHVTSQGTGLALKAMGAYGLGFRLFTSPPIWKSKQSGTVASWKDDGPDNRLRFEYVSFRHSGRLSHLG